MYFIPYLDMHKIQLIYQYIVFFYDYIRKAFVRQILTVSSRKPKG